MTDKTDLLWTPIVKQNLRITLKRLCCDDYNRDNSFQELSSEFNGTWLASMQNITVNILSSQIWKRIYTEIVSVSLESAKQIKSTQNKELKTQYPLKQTYYHCKNTECAYLMVTLFTCHLSSQTSLSKTSWHRHFENNCYCESVMDRSLFFSSVLLTWMNTKAVISHEAALHNFFLF